MRIGTITPNIDTLPNQNLEPNELISLRRQNSFSKKMNNSSNSKKKFSQLILNKNHKSKGFESSQTTHGQSSTEMSAALSTVSMSQPQSQWNQDQSEHPSPLEQFDPPQVDCRAAYHLHSRGKLSTFPLTFNFLFEQNLKVEENLKKRQMEEKVKAMKLKERRRRREEKERQQLQAQGIRAIKKKKQYRRRKLHNSVNSELKMMASRRVISPVDIFSAKVRECMGLSKRKNMEAAQNFCLLLSRHVNVLKEKRSAENLERDD
jgi:hypothetical protein